ncbi:cobalamin-binding protein [Streptomyces finlayi]|uniref:Cobalamin-binding protein n=1 Tax=Streptomyces finlayi TaxID=67296 RepID=A0A7G7BW49_9ACTN|nr:cobalamin-binding protein [Streptomyces finlayi]QNE79564.1 cobalamin-binding protein [Streptomyces finlayi]
MESVRTAFDDHLARADETAAVALVLELLASGVSAEDVLLGLIAPAQAAVGEHWVTNEWSVAQEHAATHVSNRAVSALAAATAVPDHPLGSVVVACPDGEWHTLPAHIVAEVLRLRGFTVRFLGAGVPTAHLISYLHQNGSDLIVLSCMLAVRLPRVYHTIEACRLARVPVMVGGAGFGPDGIWARALGADLYARTAVDAADLLVGQWPPPLSGEPALDHLADGEYTQLVSRRGELLRHLADHLRRHFPPMGRCADDRYEAAVEDLGFLVDFLAAGVFVDDPRVFTDFLLFLAGVLAHRGIPPAGLDLAVQALCEPLSDLPRALTHLAAGRGRLERAGHTWADA